jgi:hypothetical protein
MGKIVRFYQTEDGKTPVKDILDSLPGKVAQKVMWVLMPVEGLRIFFFAVSPGGHFHPAGRRDSVAGSVCPT